MSWIFGTIDFLTYGVMVSKSTGVLDLPVLKHDGYDWLDEDGKDYWQSETKYNDRQVALNCWIFEEATKNAFGEVVITGYDNFRAKVEAFTEALKIQGKATLQTPYANILNCSVSEGVTIVRETNYVQDLQVGTFTLKINVHADSDYSLVSIISGAGSPVKEVVKSVNLILNKSLQADRYATCTVETNRLLNLAKYDFIRINSNGSYTEVYHLEAQPEFKKISHNKFVYDLKFVGGEAMLKQTQFLFEGEADFPFWGNLETIIDLIATNADRFLSGRFLKGNVATTTMKNHMFSGENCLDVLRRMVAEYELEYNLRFTGGATIHYYIDVEEQIGNVNPVTLEYGKGNGLYELTRGQADNSKLCTVLYAYGAAKNLKATYGSQRLVCPGNPLKDNWSTFEHHEQTMFFDDIYPERTSIVTGYLQVLPEALTAAEKEVYPEGIFAVGDTALLDPVYGFDLNQYLLGGLTAKIRMKTGALAGYEFDILRYDPLTQIMQIIRFQDESGFIVPNATLQIAPGDEYTLVDIDQPPVYVQDAEDRLLAAATAYIEKWSTPIFPYQAKVNPAFILANPGTGFEVGDKITVVDGDYAINALFRISGMQYNVHTGIFDLTLSDYRLLNKRQQSEFRLQTIERALFSTKKETVEVIKNDRQTTGELRREMMTPDGKLRADTRIARSTLDPAMLADDAGIPQWNVRDALVEANWADNPNFVRVSTGQIRINNDPTKTLDRYGIEQKRLNLETYDPTREWDVEETVLELTDTNGYFLYAKLNMTPESRECVIFADQNFIQAKRDFHNGYVIHQIGYISKDEEEVEL